MLTGIHHLGLTVRDLEASATWYVDVLGFQRIGEYVAPGGGWRKVFLRHDGVAARLTLAEHRGGGPDPFDETHVGLDHLAFGVSDRGELDEWVALLDGAGVLRSPIAKSNIAPGAAVLVFRDPDNIQLEIYFDPSWPGSNPEA